MRWCRPSSSVTTLRSCRLITSVCAFDCFSTARSTIFTCSCTFWICCVNWSTSRGAAPSRDLLIDRALAASLGTKWSRKERIICSSTTRTWSSLSFRDMSALTTAKLPTMSVRSASSRLSYRLRMLVISSDTICSSRLSAFSTTDAFTSSVSVLLCIIFSSTSSSIIFSGPSEPRLSLSSTAFSMFSFIMSFAWSSNESFIKSRSDLSTFSLTLPCMRVRSACICVTASLRSFLFRWFSASLL
mmetsp:Transcript_22965/g.38442  ORF Transcript_22965/g.38442 Transcript_22965/m.38442 type:complete len:243 (+) Transcript_22965:235-963(+)